VRYCTPILASKEMHATTVAHVIAGGWSRWPAIEQPEGDLNGIQKDTVATHVRQAWHRADVSFFMAAECRSSTLFGLIIYLYAAPPYTKECDYRKHVVQTSLTLNKFIVNTISIYISN